jgi:hypothetical protein
LDELTMQKGYSRATFTVVAALFCGACTGGSGPRLEGAPVVRGKDGREYRVLAKGAYKAFYDSAGRVDRLEYDSNGDGKTDQTAYYDGADSPRRLEVDSNFDGRVDRWEAYDDHGGLVSVGTSQKHGDRPDVWTFRGPGGETQRVEIDSDGDGRVDRWQRWEGARLVTEDVDSDGDGKPDHRLKYDAHGKVTGIEALQ